MNTGSLFVIVPGFGKPYIENKKEFLSQNVMQVLSKYPGTVNVLVCVYDAEEFQSLKPMAYNNVSVSFIGQTGIVSQYLIDFAVPGRLRAEGYKHVMILLDDIVLHPETWHWGEILQYIKDFSLDIVSPTLTPASISQHPYMFSEKDLSLRIATVCEMFCYLFSSVEAYEKYYSYLDRNNPWNWGLDLMLWKWFGLRVGLLDETLMTHTISSGGGMIYGLGDPNQMMCQYLAKYGLTWEDLRCQKDRLYEVVANKT
jgi:hypothetical protein